MTDVFLNSTPKLNLKTTKREHISPNDYTIKESTFNGLLKKHNLEFNDVVFVMLNKGAKLICGV